MGTKVDSGQLTEGMIAPGEVVVLWFPVPDGLIVNSPAGISLSVDVVSRSQKVTLTTWTITVPEAGWIRATYLPTGREFKAGPASLFPTLTVAGVPYRYQRRAEMIGEWR